MSDDRRTRPTVPPLQREDDPPMVRPARREAPKGETIAKIALRAPRAPVDPPSEHDQVMRALASVTAGLEEKLSAQQESFEERLQESLRAVVIEEIPRHASASLPPSEKKTAATSWFAHVPATLMGLAALAGVIAQSCQKKAEVSADVLAKIEAVNTALVAHIAVSDKAALEQSKQGALERSYRIDERNWLADVAEKLSVKVDDPPGAPSHQKMEFYPTPLVGSKAPAIQPKATFPYPP